MVMTFMLTLGISSVIIAVLIFKQNSKNKEIKSEKSYNRITLWMNWMTTFNLYL
jgi:hypothetical protein